MSIRNIVTKNIILPLSDVVLGQSVHKHFKFLLKSQWWSKENLTNYQNRKLRKLIQHSYDNVTYYRELFDNLGLKPSDIKTTEDLQKLPILTKDIVRKNIKNGKLIAKNISRKNLILNGSSGSTGEPLQYYITKNAYSFNIAANLRGWYWMGYRLGDRYIKISQNPRKGLKKIQDRINNCHYLFAQQLTDETFSELVKEIIRIKPQFMRGYPDPMFFLAKHIKKNKIVLPPINAINTTGNILFPDVRKTIEEAFNCKVFDSYSCEGGSNVFECSMHKFYHSSMEYAITEIISNRVNINKGGKGRVITTDLVNYAVPFIRYDTQDYITKSKDKCDCGRSLLEIDKIDGRDSDILISPQGKYLIVHIFTIFFEWIETVEQFQVRQEKIDKFIFLLKVNDKFTKKEEEKIYEYWKKYIGGEVTIEISVVVDIPLAPSGKRRFLIRNKNVKLDIN